MVRAELGSRMTIDKTRSFTAAYAIRVLFSRRGELTDVAAAVEELLFQWRMYSIVGMPSVMSTPCTAYGIVAASWKVKWSTIEKSAEWL